MDTSNFDGVENEKEEKQMEKTEKMCVEQLDNGKAFFLMPDTRKIAKLHSAVDRSVKTLKIEE